MICPYQDIGCFHIDDVSHECEKPGNRDCPHDLRDYECSYRAPKGYAYSRRNLDEEDDE
ncbi:MAG: hypothetical protein Pg6A_12570 [Termitinemataceae bacterium]|jgi:hypothetical protein|nr:MAG: hypothetical protein Pg6A_12570 [Termitinemataceae bacterium]